MQEEAKRGLIERQETQKALLEGVAGLELALSKSQGELARLEAEARNHSMFIQRVRNRLKRGTAAAEAAGDAGGAGGGVLQGGGDGRSTRNRREGIGSGSGSGSGSGTKKTTKKASQKKTKYAAEVAAENIARMPRTAAGEWPLYAEQLDQEVLAITTSISEARAGLAATQEDNRTLDVEIGTLKGQASKLAAENKRLVAQLADTDNQRMAAVETAASTKRQAHAAVEQLRKQTAGHAGALQASLEQQILHAQGEAEDAYASRNTAVAVAKQAVSQFAAMDQQARVLLVAVQHGAGTVLETMASLRFQKALALREAATAADHLALVWEWASSWHVSTGGAGPPPPMPAPSMFAATHSRTSPSFRTVHGGGGRNSSGGEAGAGHGRVASRRVPPRTRFKAWVRAVIAARRFRRLTSRKMTSAEQRRLAVSADPAPLDDPAALLIAAAEQGLKAGKPPEEIFRGLVGGSFKLHELSTLAPPQQYDVWGNSATAGTAATGSSIGTSSNSNEVSSLSAWLTVYTKRLAAVNKQDADRYNAVDDTRRALEQQSFDL